MKFLLPLCTVLCVALGGCLQTADDGSTTKSPDMDDHVLEVAGTSVALGGAFAITDELVGPPTNDVTDPVDFFGAAAIGPADWSCADGQCMEWPVTVNLPSGFWADHDGHLEIAITTNVTGQTFDDGRSFDVRILQGDTPIAQGVDSFMGSAALAVEPENGEYTLQVRARAGSGPFFGAIQLDYWLEIPEGTELMPDLITLVPKEFLLELPGCLTVSDPRCNDEARAKGCYGHEADAGAKRCLRFTNVIGNVGQGPLEMRMAGDSALASVTGEGEWRQLIHKQGGDVREEIVGSGFFHPEHSHMHFQEMARYRLYDYNLATHERGELVRDGGKIGFCLGDYGIVRHGLTGTWQAEPALRDLTDCMAPVDDGDVRLVLNPHWFDPYWSTLADQFIDIDGVPDGIYEVVGVVNYESAIFESSLANSEGSAVIVLEGDTVTPLFGWSAGLCELGGACKHEAIARFES